ncbi:hypothetical protein SteCoe_6816 [Stentor coeruleus]|uniref:Cyclic nucleotide-binding domain-containing protein n=1 Tax=Stentor coeruleus TaxID=5963 RepID=A0A1R2CP09_9CILI|nr:hypothetical protein SteCoe_6816 [Stentor coeruleus]
MISIEILSKIKDICNLPKSKRSALDIEWLANIMKTLNFFHNLVKTQSFETLLNVCQYLSFEIGYEDDYIFKFGEPGYKYYIILQGKVGILAPVDEFNRFAEVMTVESGNSFGEIALETSKPRGASAICRETTYLVTLEKKQYLRFFMKMLMDTKHDIVQFLHSLPVFNKVSHLVLLKLTYNMKEKNYTKGQAIFKEGENAQNVFLIRSGECKLCNYFPRNSNHLATIASRQIKDVDCLAGSFPKSKNSSFRSVKKFSLYTSKILGKGSIVGEESTLTNGIYAYSCVCSSDFATIYAISSKEFCLRLTHDESLETFKNNSKVKLRSINEWKKVRLSLKDIFNKKNEPERQKEIVEKALSVPRRIKLKNSYSERKLTQTRYNYRNKLETYTSQLDNSEKSPALTFRNLQAKKRIKQNDGLSVFSMNCLPIFEGLWTKKIEKDHTLKN